MSRRCKEVRWPSTKYMLLDVAKPLGPGGLGHMAHSNGHPAWSGASSWEQALDMARTGINKTIAKVSIDDARVGHGIAPRLHHDVMGNTADVGRIAAGVPDCMVRRDRRENPLMIRAFVHIGGNCHVDKATLETRGQNVIQALRVIEETGARVSLTAGVYAVENNRGPCPAILVAVDLKTFGSLVDPQEIAFYLSNVAAYRHIMFRAMCHTVPDAELATYGGGSWPYLGRSEPLPEDYVPRDFDVAIDHPTAPGDVPSVDAIVRDCIETARERQKRG